MSFISSFINFRENLSRNIPYYTLLSERLCPRAELSVPLEHAVLSAGRNSALISRICEGYQFVIAFSGKLFHTHELSEQLKGCGYQFTSDTDAELALFSYIHFGEKSPEKLSGSFSYIIYDSMRGQIFAAVDPYASFPLFYSESKEGFLISASPDSLLHGARQVLSACDAASILLPIADTVSDHFGEMRLLAPGHFLKLGACSCFEKAYLAPEHTPCMREFLRAYPTDDAGVLLTGSADKELLRALCEKEAECNRRVTVYTCFPIKKPLPESPLICRLTPDEGTVSAGLEASLSACAFPILSLCDYLFFGMLRFASGRSENLFASRPSSPDADFAKVIYEHELLHQAVSASIEAFKRPVSPALNSVSLIARSAGREVHIPPIPSDDSAFADFSLLLPPLRRILLDIISRDSSPILAFFQRNALLALCEGGLRIPPACEASLISYIIKLNIWFLKYKPCMI